MFVYLEFDPEAAWIISYKDIMLSESWSFNFGARHDWNQMLWVLCGVTGLGQSTVWVDLQSTQVAS